MRIIKLMPKANEDLEGIWYYSYHHFGEPQADRYVEHLSDVLQILSNNNIGTPRPELGEGIFVLPFERPGERQYVITMPGVGCWRPALYQIPPQRYNARP